jgi:hypothetical protein
MVKEKIIHLNGSRTMTTKFPIKIISMYWNNIAPEIRQKQQQVFDRMSYPISQMEKTGQQHGEFLDEQMKLAAPDDILVFVDIDCIPLNSNVINEAIQFAKDGGIWGCSQVSNHLSDPTHEFIAPLFHAIQKKTWLKIGSPSYQRNGDNDVGQRVTRHAEEHAIPLYFSKPEYSLIPKYRFNQNYPYGIGCFFQGGIFHLYESRRKEFRPLFTQVCDAVLDNHKIDYLDLTNQALDIEAKRRLMNKIKTPIRAINNFSRFIRKKIKQIFN